MSSLLSVTGISVVVVAIKSSVEILGLANQEVVARAKRLSSRAKRGTLVPACVVTQPALQAKTKVPRFARDDNGNSVSRAPGDGRHNRNVITFLHRGRLFLYVA